MKNKSISIYNIEKIILFIYILVYSILGSKSNTVYVTEIFLLALFAIAIMQMISKNKIRLHVIFLMMITFSSFCFLSNIWAINSSIAIQKSITLFELSILSIIVYNIFCNQKDGMKDLLKIIMLTGVLFSIYVIFYFGPSKYFAGLLAGQRMGGEIDNVNIIGKSASISFIIASFFGINEDKKFFFLLPVPLIVALGSGSRKALLMMLVGLALIIFYKFFKKINIKTMIKTIMIIFLILIILNFISQLPLFSVVFERLTKMFNGFTGKGEIDFSTSVRLQMIKSGMEQFWKTPFLGIGISNSRYIAETVGKMYGIMGWYSYLHNNFVELLSSVGIIGFCLYYQIYAYVIFKCFKQRKVNQFAGLVLILFLILLIMDYGMVSYYDKTTYIMFALGMLSVTSKKKHTDIQIMKEGKI